MPKVLIGEIKTRALNFPEPVRTLILSEPDELEPEDLISKFGTWMKLLQLDKEIKKTP